MTWIAKALGAVGLHQPQPSFLMPLWTVGSTLSLVLSSRWAGFSPSSTQQWTCQAMVTWKLARISDLFSLQLCPTYSDVWILTPTQSWVCGLNVIFGTAVTCSLTPIDPSWLCRESSCLLPSILPALPIVPDRTADRSGQIWGAPVWKLLRRARLTLFTETNYRIFLILSSTHKRG